MYPLNMRWLTMNPASQATVLVPAALVVLLGVAPSASGRAKVVYVGQPESPQAEQDVAAQLRVSAPGLRVDGRPVHLSSLFEGDGYLSLAVQRLDACEGAPVARATYLADVEALRQAFRRGQDIRPILERLRSSWRCLTEPVPPGEIAIVPALTAMDAYSRGEREVVSNAFVAALTIDPSFELPRGSGQEVESIFGEVADSMANVRRISIHTVAPPGAAVWIDGVRTDDPVAGIRVAPGTHLVQILVSFGEPFGSLLVDVGGPHDAFVVHPAAFEPGTGGDPAFAGRMEELFRALQEGCADPPDALVIAGPSPAVIRTDEPKHTDRRPWSPGSRATRTKTAGAVLIGLGAAAAIGGGITIGVGLDRQDYLMALAVRELVGVVEDDGTLVADLNETDEDENYNEWIVDYYDPQRDYNALVVHMGIGIAATGGVALITGIILRSIGVRQSRLAIDGLVVQPTRSGVAVSLSGRF